MMLPKRRATSAITISFLVILGFVLLQFLANRSNFEFPSGNAPAPHPESLSGSSSYSAQEVDSHPGAAEAVSTADTEESLASGDTIQKDDVVERSEIIKTERPDLEILRISKGKPGDDDSFEEDSLIEMVANRIIVSVNEGITAKELRKTLGAKGIERVADNLYLVSSPEFHLETVNELLSAARQSEVVTFAEPDYILRPSVVPNDPDFGLQWALRNTGQNGGIAGADSGASAAWATRNSASDIVIAITDTGLNITHQDIAPNLWRNPGEILNGIDDDGNGIVDDLHGLNTVFNNGDVRDDDGHGTHVAGVAGAAGNNGIGISGVAWDVQLMTIKFIVGGSGTTSDAVEAIDYAVSEGADIINASWGGPGYSFSLDQAINRARLAGVIVVTAAGNESANNDAVPSYPANYTLDNIISVGSSTIFDTRSSFSNFGQSSVDLFAPGSNIYSTWYSSNSSYRSLSGTSMASPLVAGAMALIMAHYPSDNYRGLIERMMTAVDRPAALTNISVSSGRLNIESSLGQSTSLTPPAILIGLNSLQVTTGTDVELSVSANGTGPLTYQWSKNGVRLPDAIGPTLFLGAVSPEDSGEYEVTVSNEAGSVASSATLQVMGMDTPLAAALDAPGFPWLTLGDASWFAQSSNSIIGDSAIQSGNISSWEFSVLQTTITGPGIVSFWWRTSSEDFFDRLSFSVNDVVRGSISGIIPWSEVSFEIEEGTHTLRWVYLKDATLSDGADAGYVDGFSFSPFSGEAPTILSQPTSAVVSPGQPASLSIAVEGDSDTRFQWFKNGELLSDSGVIFGTRSAELNIVNVTSADAGFYDLLVFNSFGTALSDEVQISVSGGLPPRIVTQPVGTSTGLRDTVVLASIADGSQPLQHQWLKDGQPLTGETSSTLTLADVSQSDSGTYQLRVSNAAGIVTSSVAEIVVLEASIIPVILKHPTRKFAQPGQAVTFQAEVGGTEPILLQWLRDGEPIEGATDTVLRINNPLAQDSGSYALVASNDFGSVQSRSAELTVQGDSEAVLFAVGASDSGLIFKNDTRSPWLLTNDVEGSQSVALRSGPIGHNGSSAIGAEILGPGTLFFRWSVSSEKSFDFLNFAVNGEVLMRVSGERDWETRSWTFGPGAHQIEWIYTKDISDIRGDDAGYLDFVFLADGLRPLNALTFFPNAQAVGSGWLFAPGLGFFYGGNFRWALHEHQGWWYLSGYSGAGFWAFDLDLGWIYTGSELYPFMYASDFAAWLFYEENTTNPRRFFDMERGGVLLVE